MKKQLKQTRNVPPVLVFNPLKRLVAIFSSMSTAAKCFGVTTVNVMYACDGRSISCHSLYFRSLDPNIEVTNEDLGVLYLQEYDEACGVKRRYYKTKNMSPSGEKTN